MDRKLRCEIAQVFAGESVRYHYEVMNEVWLIGQQIVEHEQHGEARADYGKGLLKELAMRLTSDFGKGFDERELRKMRQFYQMFKIRDTLRPELTWSHYRRLISVENVPRPLIFTRRDCKSISTTQLRYFSSTP